MASVKNFTILVLCSAGSKYETSKINGVSHFLEHLFFKGTRNRHEPSEIHEAFDSIGASHNAFTSREISGYWVKAASRHFDFVLEVLSDMLLNPLFKVEEIEKERSVILQEIAMYNDTPMKKILDFWPQSLYPNTPAGQPILGSLQTVKNIKRDEIIAYKESRYIGQNLVVICAGNFPFNGYEKIKKCLSSVKTGRRRFKKKILESQLKPCVKFHYQKTDQTHLVLGVRAYDLYNSRKYALELASVILGGNTSSRIFKQIREQLGLAYYVHSETDLETDVGSFYIRVGVSHEKLEMAAKKIVENFQKIKKEGVIKEELSRAKEYFRGQMAISLESSDEMAVFYGEQEIFKEKILTPEEVLKKFLSVDLENISAAANEIFIPSKINLVAIGPQKNKEIYQKILSRV